MHRLFAPPLFFCASRRTATLMLAFLLALPVHAQAQDQTLESITHALTGGAVDFAARYRFEWVDDDNFRQRAKASTLKMRMTYLSKPVNQIRLGVETDYVAVIGPERYNSTENGLSEYPVVADPQGFDLNQAYLQYQSGRLSGTLGRQRILMDQQRFVGGVAWRQNEQTYDAARLIYHSGAFTLDYAYVWNVNRIFGPEDGDQPADWHGNTHLFNLKYQISEYQSLSGYAYLQDFENDNGPPNSVMSYGMNYQATLGNLKVFAELAQQRDHADNSRNYQTHYYAANLDYSLSPIDLLLGYEVLASDNADSAFRTPLATLHKFQGWSDKFLITPDTGVKDFYLGVRETNGKLHLGAVWHHFRADKERGTLGRELNVSATYQLNRHISIQVKLANYDAVSHATDTTKAWLTLQARI